MKRESQTSVGPAVSPAKEKPAAASIQALSLPLIAPGQAYRLRNVIIRKPRTFIVEIRLKNNFSQP